MLKPYVVTCRDRRQHESVQLVRNTEVLVEKYLAFPRGAMIEPKFKPAYVCAEKGSKRTIRFYFYLRPDVSQTTCIGYSTMLVEQLV